MWFLSGHPAAARRNTAEAIKNKITRRHLVNGIQTRAWSYTSRKQSYGFDKMKCIKKKEKKRKRKKRALSFFIVLMSRKTFSNSKPIHGHIILGYFSPKDDLSH